MFGDAVEATGAVDAADAFAQIVARRRSTRAFRPEPLPASLIATALTLAGRAPSNCNVQPWLLHVASGDTLARIGTALVDAARSGTPADDDFGNTARYPGIYRERQVDTAQRLYAALGIARHDTERRQAALLRNYAFFGAPHAAFLFVPDWVGPREIADCGMYLQTLMLALTALGAASCPQAALGAYAGIARSILGVADGQRLLFGLSFGYADPTAPENLFPIERAPLSSSAVLHD